MSRSEVSNTTMSTTRRDRFVRIAERRVNKILENLNNLGKCSNKRNYVYSENDIIKIFREIERKVKETRLLFQGNNNGQARFKL
ncbi:MAG: hypothetical protein ACXADH_09300 [Candidatus Kariarchaeaceae archaeon]|jgi:hypothetical protein